MQKIQQSSIGKWYALTVVSGSEESIKTRIIERVRKFQQEKLINLQFICPDEEILTTTRTGKTSKKRRMSMPGYILLFSKRPLDEDVINVIIGAKGVFEFIGGNKNPLPLPKDQVDKLLGRSDKISNSNKEVYKVGDTVRVVDGPLSDFTGQVTEVRGDTGQIYIDIEIFGKSTNTHLNINQVTLG